MLTGYKISSKQQHKSENNSILVVAKRISRNKFNEVSAGSMH